MSRHRMPTDMGADARRHQKDGIKGTGALQFARHEPEQGIGGIGLPETAALEQPDFALIMNIVVARYGETHGNSGVAQSRPDRVIDVRKHAPVSRHRGDKNFLLYQLHGYVLKCDR